MVTLSTCKFVSHFHTKWLNLFDLSLEPDPTAIIAVGSTLPEIFLDVISICKTYLDVILG